MPTAIGTAISHAFQNAANVAYLLLDNFTTALTAGSVDGTDAEPGPGTRNVTDTQNLMPISGGSIITTGTDPGLPQHGDPGLWYGSIARAAGLAIITDLPSITAANWTVGFDDDQLAALHAGINFLNASAARIYDGAVHSNIFTFTESVDLKAATILRSAGAFYLVKQSGPWKLVWVGVSNTGDPVYPALSTSRGADSAVDVDRLAVAQLPAPWDTDYAFATDRLAGARSNGDTFTHEQDFFLEFTIDTLPSSGSGWLYMRKQDDNNNWRVRWTSTGNLLLEELVAGTPTSRISATGVLAGGERIAVVADDETIALYYDATRAGSYASAANYKTETAGELDTEGTGGAVSDIVSYPRYPSGAALAELQRV